MTGELISGAGWKSDLSPYQTPTIVVCQRNGKPLTEQSFVQTFASSRITAKVNRWSFAFIEWTIVSEACVDGRKFFLCRDSIARQCSECRQPSTAIPFMCALSSSIPLEALVVKFAVTGKHLLKGWPTSGVRGRLRGHSPIPAILIGWFMMFHLQQLTHNHPSCDRLHKCCKPQITLIYLISLSQFALPYVRRW